MEDLQRQNQAMQHQLAISQQSIDQMSRAFESGYFKQDKDLNIIPVDDPEEREYLARTNKKKKQEQ